MNLRLAQLAPEALEGVVLLLHLSAAVLQLRLQQLRCLLLIGHPAAGLEPRLLQLLHVFVQRLKRRGTRVTQERLSLWRRSQIGRRGKP